MAFNQCESCQEKISQKQRWVSAFFSYRPIVCQECGASHHIEPRSRIKGSMFVVFFPLFLAIFLTSGGEGRPYELILTYLPLALLGMLYTVHTVNYRMMNDGEKEGGRR